MKKFIVAVALLLVSFNVVATEPKPDPKLKLVCIEQTDPKTQKPVQTCRAIKLHKKLEGTPVPQK